MLAVQFTLLISMVKVSFFVLMVFVSLFRFRYIEENVMTIFDPSAYDPPTAQYLRLVG